MDEITCRDNSIAWRSTVHVNVTPIIQSDSLIGIPVRLRGYNSAFRNRIVCSINIRESKKCRCERTIQEERIEMGHSGGVSMNDVI